ncbi:MAG: branched-chain amino acid ABC transporter permease [Desulfobacteraceae bacterium]|jgi:branched-chain amino acid transport system permease protein|nr:MAG: branched-chain amino acid ABC transporter permease [Desulfobacteraceae bacterium]
MLSADILIQTIVSGLLMGCLYALIAVGLCMIWGLMEIVNFAHGDMMMHSMYFAFWLWALFSIDPLVSMPLILILLFAAGVLVYFVIIKRVLKAPMLAQILSTFGLSIFIRYLAQYLYTPDTRMVQEPWLEGRIDIAGIFIGVPQLAASIVSVAAFFLLYQFIHRTEMGGALLAVSEDREAASLMGINSDRMFALGWGIGAACLGVSGAMMANFYPITPEVGLLFSLIAYVAVALGGFGSIVGAFIGGVTIGLVESLSGVLVAPAFKYLFVFAVYLLVVFIRPQGLWGRY